MKKLLTTSILAVSLAASPIAFAYEGGKPDSMMMQSSKNAEKAPYDIQFLDTMAEHHRHGIMMAKMAINKAQDQKIKDMAEKTISDQEKEIAGLQKMHEDINASASQAVNMKLPGMKPMNMKKLESSSGMEFDREFLQMMIKHHKGGIEMSKDALKKANNQKVKDKAQEIIDKQNKEITEMQQMLSEHKM